MRSSIIGIAAAGLALLAVLALLSVYGDPQPLPSQPSAAVIDVAVGADGAASIELRLGGSPTVDELEALGGAVAQEVFAGAPVDVTVDDDKGAGDYVRIDRPHAYERHRRARLPIDLAPLGQRLDAAGYRDVSVQVTTPAVPVTITGDPEPTRTGERSATWEPAGTRSAPRVEITMAPEPGHFWLLLTGVTLGVAGCAAGACVLARRRRHDDVATRRRGVRIGVVTVAIAVLCALSTPFEQIDDVAVAFGLSPGQLTAARIVAGSAYVMAVVAVVVLLRLTAAVRPAAPFPPPTGAPSAGAPLPPPRPE